MSFEEEFDRIIKQKAEEANYRFDERNWEKARAMVDADRKATTRPAAMFYGIAVVFLGLGLAAWLIVAGLQSEPVPVTAAKSPEKEHATADLKQEAPAVTSQSLKAFEIPAVPVAIVHESKAIKPQATMPAVPAIIQAQVVRAEKQAQTTAQNMAPEAREDRTAETRQEPVAENSTASDPAPLTTALQPGSQEPAATPAEASVSHALPIAAPATSRQEAYEPLDLVYYHLPAGEEQELRVIINKPVKLRDNDYYKTKLRKTHFLNVEAGAAYLTGWEVKDGKDGQGFNWLAGINFGLYFSKKLSASAGWQMYNISHISTPFYTNTKTAYNFGSTSTHTIITSSDLYYAALPLRVYYSFTPKSQFGLGVNTAMLVNARSTLETYGLSDKVKMNAEKVTKTGIYEGINTTNVLLSAFYRTQVGKRLYVNGEVIYGISDIFKNLETDNNERAMGLRLSLQYTLVDK